MLVKEEQMLWCLVLKTPLWAFLVMMIFLCLGISIGIGILSYFPIIRLISKPPSWWLPALYGLPPIGRRRRCGARRPAAKKSLDY